jgi:hypothetical protein
MQSTFTILLRDEQRLALRGGCHYRELEQRVAAAPCIEETAERAVVS